MISGGRGVNEKLSNPITRLTGLGKQQLLAANEPGAFLVDLIPACERPGTTICQLRPNRLASIVLSLVHPVPSEFQRTGWKELVGS